jgi:hypothetical protein
VSAYEPSELFPVPGLEMQDGAQALVFSSRHPKTVNRCVLCCSRVSCEALVAHGLYAHRHFRWMAEHGVDGAFLQRFAGQCDLEAGNHGIRRLRDEVGGRVREAAEKEGRVFAIMYVSP